MPTLIDEINIDETLFIGAHLKSAKETLERLKRKTVIDENGCWIYKGSQDNDGHSIIQVSLTDKQVGIHRYSFHIFKGFDLTSKSLICHKCNVPNCWNPDHLYEGTNSSNNMDTLVSGRNFWSSQTHCIHGHEFNEQNTLIDKRGHRSCRECCKLKMRRRRQNANAN